MRTKTTDDLEAQLGALREELDQTVNRVTAEALKRKAARLGRIGIDVRPATFAVAAPN